MAEPQSDRVTGIVVLCAGKGGVGKTTSVRNIAEALKRLGCFAEVPTPDFVLDLDYGASLTRSYGYEPNNGFAQAVLEGRVTIADALHETNDGIMLVPTDARIGLANPAEARGWAERLRELGRERLLVIDTSDDILSAAVIAAILSADVLAIPLELTKEAWERAFPEIRALLEAVPDHKPDIVWFATKVEGARRVSKEVEKDIARDGVVLANRIPRAAAVGEAAYAESSVVRMFQRNPASIAYGELANTIYARLRERGGATPGTGSQKRQTRPLPAQA
jgi:cellulose biosynthesis protein BcsQ